VRAWSVLVVPLPPILLGMNILSLAGFLIIGLTLTFRAPETRVPL
jgi:hypothetical protein